MCNATALALPSIAETYDTTIENFLNYGKRTDEYEKTVAKVCILVFAHNTSKSQYIRTSTSDNISIYASWLILIY